MLPTPSHYTPCFGLANDLQAQGYTVVFCGTAPIANLVQQHGFAFLLFDYMLSYEVTTLRSFVGTLIKSMIDNRFGRSRFREYMSGVAAAHELYHTQQPSIIYIDEHLNHYYAYFAQFTKSLCLVNTKLSTRRTVRIPPLNSCYIAHSCWLSALCSNYLWGQQVLVKRWRNVIKAIAFLGRSDIYFQKRFFKRIGSTVQSNHESAIFGYNALPGVKTLILMADAFEYPWIRHIADETVQHYWNLSNHFNDGYIDRIIAWKQPGLTLIYCGIGTLAGRNSKQYTEFFRQIITAFGNVAAYQVVISTGNTNSYEKLEATNLPNNILVVDSLNQQLLLPHCDLMITHGGLNSVKECIAATVPMLGIVNPADKHKDTLGNIARIVYHRIGLRCQISDKAPRIRHLVEKILSDCFYKKNCKKMKDAINLQFADTVTSHNTVCKQN